MVKRLILMRHAKSSWDDPWLDDHARPLNARGRRSAAALGDWLRARGHLPDMILSSDARRTRDTCDGLALNAPVTYTPTLYHADAETMLDALDAAQGDTVLMVGHNPGIGDFARRILSDLPDHPRFHDYPTCATLVAELPVAAWDKSAFGVATALDFVVPRELV